MSHEKANEAKPDDDSTREKNLIIILVRGYFKRYILTPADVFKMIGRVEGQSSVGKKEQLVHLKAP